MKQKKKIFYCLIPPPELRNIGDHAQAVAIRLWFNKNYSEYKILEIDKNRIDTFIWVIRKLLSPNDLFFIHSGGNLSDRALWSEEGRRRVIATFQQNLVCVLPQTIFFSNTDKGRTELEITKNIYDAHPNLIVTGRDFYSTELAHKYFKNATITSCPDFVLLYSSYFRSKVTSQTPGKDVLFCFRNDPESALTKEDRTKLKEIESHKIEEFDTTIENYIYKNKEQYYLDITLNYFSSFKIIVTDRYHGLIFSILAKRPCVILPTVDHKLTAACDSWFKDLPGIHLSKNIDQAKENIDKLLQGQVAPISNIDWENVYFNKYANKINTHDSLH